jgi:hypothetical protein
MLGDQFNIIQEGGQRRYVNHGGNILRIPFDSKTYGQWIYAMADNYKFGVVNSDAA